MWSAWGPQEGIVQTRTFRYTYRLNTLIQKFPSDLFFFFFYVHDRGQAQGGQARQTLSRPISFGHYYSALFDSNWK